MSMELLAISGKRPAIRMRIHRDQLLRLDRERQDIHRARDECRTQKCSFTLFDSCPNSSLASLIVDLRCARVFCTGA
jgi:hypothetical protein